MTITNFLVPKKSSSRKGINNQWMNPGSIANQLRQQRWKSTLHSRGGRTQTNNYIPNQQKVEEKGKFFQKFLNLHKGNRDSSVMRNIKITTAMNPRSASFQPSVIKRREGNELKDVDIRKEMIQNIKRRRQGKFI